MFSPNGISKLLEICDKNFKLTGKISTKYVKNVLYKVIGATLTYTPKACSKCGCVNENFSIVKNGSQNVKVLINRVIIIQQF